MNRNYKSGLVLLSSLLVLESGVASFSQSSGGTFTITSQVVAGGGCGPNGSGGCMPSIASGNLSLDGTVAEAGAADLSRQPPFSLRGGFWYETLGATPTAANGKVSGQLVDRNGNPVEGAAIRMSGTQNRLTVTNASGFYHFDNVETNGFYTVTPSRVNFTFTPSQRSFSQLGIHTDAAFTGTPESTVVSPLVGSVYFVRQQYLDFLNREPDEAGLNFWVNNIEACSNDAKCLAARRTDTSAAFFLSIEFQQTGYLVYRIYQSAYGDMPNAPVPVRLSEFKPDSQAISNQVIVNQAGWQDTLEANKKAFAEGFVQRTRFAQAYPSSLQPDQFIDQLFLNIGITPDSVDRAAAIAEFGSATNTADAAARGRALRKIAENSALARKEFNQAFVLMQYFGYLRRDPNAPPEQGLDYSGYNFWLTKLNQFDGNFANAEMVEAFIVSAEYQHRFGP